MVYGVFGGEYSDWYVLGYFDSKEEAEAYCESYNDSLTDKWSTKIYIKEIPNLKDGKKEGDLVCFEYGVDEIIGRGFSFAVCDWENFFSEVPERKWVMKDNVFFVWIYPEQVGNVMKIIYDRLAEYKAEQEGIA